MFGTIIIGTWIVGVVFLLYEIITAPEFDENERPIKRNNIG